MFSLAAKVAEIVATYALRLLDYRKATRDSDVARRLVGIVLLLQELCVRGENLLPQARRFADDSADSTTHAKFDRTLSAQVATMGKLRHALDSSRELLATVDAGLYLELAPFLDDKSGLLTRWKQQRRSSTFSTTTLFFLPAAAVDQIAEAGRTGAMVNGLTADRADVVGDDEWPYSATVADHKLECGRAVGCVDACDPLHVIGDEVGTIPDRRHVGGDPIPHGGDAHL